MEKLHIYNKKDFNLSGYNKTMEFDINYFKPIDGININDIYKYDIAVDEIMHTRGLALMAAVKVYYCGTTSNLIMYDTSFEKLPLGVQEFLMYHEIGHIVNKNLDTLTESEAKNLIIKRALFILPKMEVEADKYAASILGTDKVKQIMLFMIKNTNLPFTSKLELLKRYLKL